MRKFKEFVKRGGFVGWTVLILAGILSLLLWPLIAIGYLIKVVFSKKMLPTRKKEIITDCAVIATLLIILVLLHL